MRLSPLPFEYESRYADHFKEWGLPLELAAVLEERDRQLENYLANVRAAAMIPEIAIFYSSGGTFPTTGSGAKLGKAALNCFAHVKGPAWDRVDFTSGYSSAAAFATLPWMSPPEGTGLCRLASGLYELSIVCTNVTSNANHVRADFVFEQSALQPAFGDQYVSQGSFEYHGTLAFDATVDQDFDVGVAFSNADNVMVGGMDWVADPAVDLWVRPITLLPD